ncbi:maleylpyruvate isomerase family mycothiol-dependent enzyme [Nocardioides sp. Kera G14]|uniref:maleylpyruvate isomerase family mycothiol-dependent enzyme n=1 Tax=Nocardioides sp. Kera G14 TaxID=2884264 RepID=UPI001D11071E|nr:maleylpyruvate isomerase family mycothiol-dependent enzyme [Nocardioides sp. Kera G14]UDY25427.1 maleylpyruvate isomerase family mycothiol-dependent enzyme [Nocardioides sp. Kera G14]
MTRPSGASEWTVAQVLSHLGSGAEIGRAPIARAAGEEVEAEDNQAIWARWDAASPGDQATGFVDSNARWLATVEGLSADQRSDLVIDLGFLPEPVPLVSAVGLRLNEVANHSWDVRVALDPAAEVSEESAQVVAELFQGPIAFLLGRLAQERPTTELILAVPAIGATLTVGDEVSVGDDVPAPRATLEGPAGAFVRLLNGRLKEPYVDGVAVAGATTLDDLRKTFPGF